MTVASDSMPSANSTTMRSAPPTTCRLVRMMPLSTMTTPLPTPSLTRSSASSLPPLPAFGSLLRAARSLAPRSFAALSFAAWSFGVAGFGVAGFEFGGDASTGLG